MFRVVKPGEFATACLIPCPLCEPVQGRLSANDSRVECKRCGHFVVGYDLMARIHGLPDRHLLGGYTRENWETTQKWAVLADDNLEVILAQCPRTVREKADKLLLAIQRQTKHFGQQVPVTPATDYPFAMLGIWASLMHSWSTWLNLDSQHERQMQAHMGRNPPLLLRPVVRRQSNLASCPPPLLCLLAQPPTIFLTFARSWQTSLNLRGSLYGLPMTRTASTLSPPRTAFRRVCGMSRRPT